MAGELPELAARGTIPVVRSVAASDADGSDNCRVESGHCDGSPRLPREWPKAGLRQMCRRWVWVGVIAGLKDWCWVVTFCGQLRTKCPTSEQW